MPLRKRGLTVTKSVRVLGAAALCLLIPGTAWPTVEASVTARDENSFGLEGDWDEDSVNLGVLDCLEDIEITVSISVSGEDTSGREIYLFSGDDCDDPDDESDECDDDVLEYDADTNTVEVPVSWLLDEADCAGDVSTGLWVGLLESEGDKEDGATWAERIDMELETSVPDAPEEVTVGVGENNLLVGWERLDEDVGAYAVVWALAEQDKVDGGQCEGPLEEGMELDGGMWWEEVGASASDARIGNLTNGAVYQVAVVTVAEGGNHAATPANGRRASHTRRRQITLPGSRGSSPRQASSFRKGRARDESISARPVSPCRLRRRAA